MKITEINKELAIEFIKKYHYSKIMPRLTKVYLGAMENNVIIGVLTLGYGTQPLGTIKKIFYKHDLKSKDYVEIGKMCFIPSMNQTNFGSQFMKHIIRWIKENMNHVMFLYTMADGIMGKVGYVYQASNFKYIGSFKTSVYMDRITGEKIHPRSAKTLCLENAKYENKNKVFWLTHKFCDYKKIDKINGLMFRYIYALNNDGKKILREYHEYNLKYPKEKDLIFERRISQGNFIKIDKPNFNMEVFEHNYQKNIKDKQLNIFDFMKEE